MDVQDQSKHATPTGHGSHGVHLCHRCGWPYPNPHPSARHRRSHKKICGTIDGYTNLILSEVVSDDEHHLDDDKDKTPSPKIEKKTSIGGAIGRSSSRSEEDSFSDAVTDFADTTSTGSANKTLDRDVFFSFKDAENGAISRVNSSEALPELPEMDEKSSDGSVKDGVNEPTPKQNDVSQSQEAEFNDDVVAGIKLETRSADGISEEIKHEKIGSECENVSEVGKEAENLHGAKGVSEEIKEEKFDLTEKEDLSAPELEKDSNELIQEVVKEPVVDLTKKEDLGAPESEKWSNEHTHEVVEESNTVLTEKEDLEAPELEKSPKEQIQEVAMEPVTVLTEKEDLGSAKLEKDSNEQIQEVVNEPAAILAEDKGLDAIEEVVKEPKSVLTEKEDLGAPEPGKDSNEQTHEVLEEANMVLTEKEDIDAPKLEKDLKIQEVVKDLGAPEPEKCSNEQIHEVVEEPVTVFAEKEDLSTPELEKSSKELTLEVVQEPNSPLIEKEDFSAPKSDNGLIEQTQEGVKEPESILTEKEDLGAPESEKCSNEHTHEVLEEPETVFTEKDDLGAQNLEKSPKEVIEEPNSALTEKEDLGAQNLDKLPKEHTQEAPKVDNCVVSEPIKIQNQDSGVDLSIDSSSHNSVEGNWGSVSVLSTASIDDKPKLASGKPDSHSGTSNAFEPPSFMTLVQPEGKDQKPGSSEVKDAQQAGWFPTIANVSNESEGRKKNEEVIAKVTNWSTGKHSAPLKNLLGEAKSPSAKEPVTVDHKDEGATDKVNQELLSSPPKLIEDSKKAGKKVKGRSPWMPFVCCSSVNVVN